jgi:hypothetical protein
MKIMISMLIFSEVLMCISLSAVAVIMSLEAAIMQSIHLLLRHHHRDDQKHSEREKLSR